MAGEAVTEFAFAAAIIEWWGPSPFFYIPLPAAEAEQVRALAKAVSYGWGMIPVTAAIGGVAFTTALFAKDATYYLPLKAAVRKKAGITAGDTVSVEMTVAAAAR